MIMFILNCDSCKDVEFGPDGSTEGECRRAARASGWRRIGGLDLCPACVAASRSGRP